MVKTKSTFATRKDKPNLNKFKTARLIRNAHSATVEYHKELERQLISEGKKVGKWWCGDVEYGEYPGYWYVYEKLPILQYSRFDMFLIKIGLKKRWALKN